ncbi:MAG: alpha/beta fold hydrolase [Pseudomonadota bacterium]
MAHVILVHGLGATDKSWFRIPDALTDTGHRVANVALPKAKHSSLNDFAAKVALELTPNEKSVLIGHSMGGLSISQVAADNPDRVSQLIYVCALVPKNGESAGEIIGALGTSLDDVGAEFDRVGISSDHPSRRFPVLGTLLDKFRSSSAFAVTPKHYVKCSRDTVILPGKQQEMVNKWSGMTASSIPSGHIPQKEEPDKLMRVILDVIQ